MIFSILHISDLHRTEPDLINNSDLVASIISDLERAKMGDPSVRWPDAIIITGDIVQGLPIGSPDYPKALKSQYSEAGELIDSLCKRVVGGDRSKVVLLPGNHDVDWNVCRNSMTVASGVKSADIPKSLASVDLGFRWSFADLALYEITDRKRYRNKLKFYREFCAKFYEGQSFPVNYDHYRGWNIHELLPGKIAVCAFDSCRENDCFCYCGDLHPRAISDSSLAFRDKPLNHELRIAAWHHDIHGGPRRQDYMDDEAVKMMVDRGYRLGFHGHQHKSETYPVLIRTPLEQSMVVVSAGSLCASGRELPTGFFRQYSIVEIHDDLGGARVHIRAMKSAGIFSPHACGPNGAAWVDEHWTPYKQEDGLGSESRLNKIDFIDGLVSQGKHAEAIAAIFEARLDKETFGRRKITNSLVALESWQELKAHLKNPENGTETAAAITAAIGTRDWEFGDQVLAKAEKTGSADALLVKQLRMRLKIEKEAHGS